MHNMSVFPSSLQLCTPSATAAFCGVWGWLVSRRVVGTPQWISGTNVCAATLRGWIGGLRWPGDVLGASALKFLPVDTLSC